VKATIQKIYNNENPRGVGGSEMANKAVKPLDSKLPDSTKVDNPTLTDASVLQDFFRVSSSIVNAGYLSSFYLSRENR